MPATDSAETPFEFRPDPYPWYSGLRDEAPVHVVRESDGVRFHLSVSMTAARHLLAHPGLSKDPELLKTIECDEGSAMNSTNPLDANMLSADPPRHTRLRRAAAAAFTPRRTEALRPQVRQVAHELMDELDDYGGEVDFVTQFAVPYSSRVIQRLLDIPAADLDRLVQLSYHAAASSGPDAARQFESTMAEIASYFDLLVARQESSGDRGGLVADLAAAARVGDLSRDELCSNLYLLLFAGFATTADFLGNALLALLRHPAQLDLLRREPALLPDGIEELLRYDSSVELSTPRVATEDVTYEGHTIPTGSLVRISLIAANRDPALAGSPDTLDLRRQPASHLAFGFGPHYCLGAPLARLEAEVAFAELFKRYRTIELAQPVETLTWRPYRHGLEHLPLRLVRAS